MIHLSTNLGPKINQIQAMIPDYGRVCYFDNTTENIFSLANLVKKYRVAYDSHKYDVFTAHTNRGKIKSRRNKQWLYVFNPSYTT